MACSIYVSSEACQQWHLVSGKPDLAAFERAQERTSAGNTFVTPRESRRVEASATLLEEAPQPLGFFTAAARAVGGTRFFAGEDERYSKIQETLTFYRDHLNKEYESLSKQADLTYYLWIVCVAVGFCILILGLILMLWGKVTQGVATAACTVIVYFIQRIFQQREDHYRRLANTKNNHLEYGNQWLLVIQSIDAIDEPTERMRRQARLVAVLTDKLKQNRPTE